MKDLKQFDFVSLGRGTLCEKPAGATPGVMVISPHPDDDVIAMGGSMRLLADEGLQVFSVYITDGAESGAEGGGKGALRRSEALAALKVVRASGAFFLHHASSALKGAGAGMASRQLQELLSLLKPAELYLPSPFERHPTHRRVTRIMLDAVKKKRPRNMAVWGYAVWGGIYGLPGSKVVDISGCLRAKGNAIRRHASQMAKKPYDRGIVGRNAYEGIFLHTHDPQYARAAETFLSLRPLQSSGWARGLMRIIAAGTKT